MKTIIVIMALIAIAFTACNNGNNTVTENKNSADNVKGKLVPTDTIAAASVAGITHAVSVKAIVAAYLQLKNAFANDNTTLAAAAGTSLQEAFKTFDKTALTATQKKTFEDVEDDAKEHAEHIGKNGGNIAHQREHFEMLSKDMYDLIKAFGGGQVLYKDFCPMYNNNKGAFWISETKEIKNPYLGKAMPTCGTVKEEIK